MESNRLKLVPLFALLGLAMACQPEEPAQPTEPEQPIEDPDESAAASGEAAGTEYGNDAPGADLPGASERVAVARIGAVEGSGVDGTVRFIPQGEVVRIRGTISGLDAGEHGFHVHAKGDCSAPDASSAGDHFAPEGHPHGAPADPPAEHHLGDLGNIVAGDDGTAAVEKHDDEMTLEGPQSVVGKAVIVHAGRDDLSSQPSGDSGEPVGCGVIELAGAGQAERTAADTIG